MDLPLADILLLSLLPLLLAASAVCSASETALFSLTGHQRLRFSRQNHLAAQAVMSLLARTRDLLITLLLSNMLINTSYFVVSTVLLIRLQERGRLSTTIASALGLAALLALILLSEVLPKLVAARIPTTIAALVSIPLLVVHRAIAPLRVFLRSMVITPLSRLLAPAGRPSALSGAELAKLLELSAERGVIDPQEEDLLQGVLSLSRLRVRDLMTPRVDIDAFDLRRPPGELLELFQNTRLSRVPVYQGDLDHVVGVVYARQALLKKPATPPEVRKLIRQISFVPELTRADQLLIQFRKRGTTIAIAVDEYGGTAGLITLEDVVEELIGDLFSPYDSEGPPQVVALTPGQWRVSADLPIHEWAQTFAPLHPRGDAVTLGGLVMDRLGRVPRVGDRVEAGNLLVEVEAMDRWRIASLRLTLAIPQSSDDPSVEAYEGEASL